MSWSYRPALDGVRTIAVYLVVLFHSGLSVAGGGFIGVDVFFVLSGFLITNVLLSDIDDCGRIRFGRFYARRIRRLLPAALAAIAATCAVFFALTTVVRRLPLVGDAQSALLYVANWRFLHEQNDYFATGVDKSPFLHFWSLGIEEQFYVVFPLLLLGLVWAGRRRTWIPLAGLGLLFTLSVALQLYWAGADPNHAYFGTDARAYQLLAGALLAYVLRTTTRRPSVPMAQGAAAVGLICVLLLGSGLAEANVSGRGLGATGATTLLIGGLTVAGSGRVHGLLSRRTPVYLGRVSYATYLWHWPVILVIREFVDVGAFAMSVAASIVATGLAALSYELLEMPVRRSDTLDRLTWPTVGAGVAACALVAVGFVPPVLESTHRPQLAASAVAAPARSAPVVPARHGKGKKNKAAHPQAGRALVPKRLDWAALANDFGPERTCDASDPDHCIVVHGTGPHILLVGDSNARMLAPTLVKLAREHGFTLSLNILSGCSWQAGLTNSSRPPEEQKACTEERDDWYRDVLPKLHPDVAILVSYARDDASVYGQTLRRTGGSDESLHELLLHTTTETVRQITEAGTRALIMKSILTSSFDPLECLAQATYLDQCAVTVPIQRPMTDGFYDAAVAEFDEAYLFDINPIACPDAPVCAPMIGRLNVWRNTNHFGIEILLHFREKIWSAIQSSGAMTGLPPAPR